MKEAVTVRFPLDLILIVLCVINYAYMWLIAYVCILLCFRY